MADDGQQNEFQKALQVFHEQQQLLLEQQQALFAQATESQKRTRKDLWDRLGAIAPILSGTIIAIGGTFFTLSYNQQQLKLQEAQTIERFIPHLLGDEKSKRAAILAISSLTDAKLAAKVASIFASPGTVSALESLARNDTSTDSKVLKSALARTLDNMAGNFVEEKRYDEAISTFRKAIVLQEQSCGPNKSVLVPNLNHLAELYLIHRDFLDADSALKRSAEIQKDVYGPESMQFAEQLRLLSAMYKEQGLDSKSQSIMNQAIAIEQKVPSSASNGGIGVAAEAENSLVDHDAASEELNTSASTEKPGHSEPASDSHNNPLIPDTSSKALNEAAGGKTAAVGKTASGNKPTGSSKSAGSEHSLQNESRSQELPNKAFELPGSDSTRFHESSMLQAPAIQQLNEKQQ